ncbi:hypothetical protein ACWC5O_45090 [Streptomyces sp. NPDC001450]|uniref:hypothetical protein n=1 Tax=Streptomyces sp. NPDC005408 TaxID=3155341 RepID=UPI0033B17E55
MAGTVVLTVKYLSSTPARIAAVIAAIAGLVIAIPHVLEPLRPEPVTVQVPAPVTPGYTSPPAPPPGNRSISPTTVPPAPQTGMGAV